MCLYRVKVPALLDRLRLGFADIQIEATPRRVAVMVSQLAKQQKGAQDKVRGPPAKVMPTHLHLICKPPPPQHDIARPTALISVLDDLVPLFDALVPNCENL